MRKAFLLFIIVTSNLLITPSCKKDKENQTTDAIQGLWLGTYNASVNGGVAYTLDFSIHPDGTMTYYSTGENNTEFYAHGSWTLTGTSFSFSVVEVSTDHTQTGTAVYSSSGTLTNGTISDALAGTNATWSMNKVK